MEKKKGRSSLEASEDSAPKKRPTAQFLLEEKAYISYMFRGVINHFVTLEPL